MMKRAGKPAGDDFEDNREPGKGRKRLWSLTRRPELDNQISIGITAAIENDPGCFRLAMDRGGGLALRYRVAERSRFSTSLLVAAHPRRGSRIG